MDTQEKINNLLQKLDLLMQKQEAFSKEVAGIIELPLAAFLTDRLLVVTQMETSYANSIAIPAFQIENHTVWGATAIMLSELKDVLVGVVNS